MMKRFVTAFLAALAWTALAVAPASAADKVVLMLNWYVYGEHAPFYYGKAKGIYAAEGIDLEIQEGRGSAATVQAVAAKTADFGYVDVPTMMRATVKGAPIIATGVLLQTSPMSVMGLVEKNIRKPADIKGKTVAITPADSMTQIWPLFLKKTGLKESDFKTVAGDGQTKLNAVINGQAGGTASSASISGYNYGVQIQSTGAAGEIGSVVNYGTIDSRGGKGVSLVNGASYFRCQLAWSPTMLRIGVRARRALCRLASPLASPGPRCSNVVAGMRDMRP